MNAKSILFIVLCFGFTASACASSPPGFPGGDSDSDSDSDADTDADTDADSDGDTDPEYPAGPYGFDPFMELDTDMTGPGTWTGDGDVIPDVCLSNALGEEVCLGDFYRSPDLELLFVDFTTMW